MPMSDEGGQHRQQALYWAKLCDLKVAASYMRRYRDYLGRWVTAIATVRAIASSVSIAAWAVWKDHPLVWGTIIAAAQVADAIKDVFPVVKRYKAASEYTVTLDSLFIDAQLEWENIYSGKYSDDQVLTRLHKLRKLHHDAEARMMKDGLPIRKDLFRQAREEADQFLETTYGVK